MKTKTQPIADRIADLCEWLDNPPELRRDAAGAVAILKEIAASHARLLAQCEGFEAVLGWASVRAALGVDDHAVILGRVRAAVANARGA